MIGQQVALVQSECLGCTINTGTGLTILPLVRCRLCPKECIGVNIDPRKLCLYKDIEGVDCKDLPKNIPIVFLPLPTS